MARRTLRDFILFGLVGVAAAAFHYGTLLVLCEGFGANPVPASALGFVAGGCVSYLLNYHVTFVSRRRHTLAASLFLLIALVGLALNALLMAILVDGLGVHYLAAQVLTTVVILFWHFLANRRWTFAPRQI
ncbi:MAG: GtrA family protein [Proteobacteria bacterium]|nr:GtrA family protein [Pseudomonadota bacterium]